MLGEPFFSNPTDYADNLGRRPVIVKGIYGDVKPDKVKEKKLEFLVTPINLPKLLKEGEYVIEPYPDPHAILDKAKSFYAIDSFDKRYFLPRKVLKSLNETLIKKG